MLPDGVGPLRAIEYKSETTATAVGSPPAPKPENTICPAYCPVAATRFLLPSTCATSEDTGTNAGRTNARTYNPSSVSFFAREIWRIVQLSSRAYAKSTASTAEIGQHGIWSLLTRTPNPAWVR